MAVSTDRFKVVSIRPASSTQYEGVPKDLVDRVEGKVVTAGELEELGAEVSAANFYHGGDALVVVQWHGSEYVLNLDPVAR